MNKYKSKNNIWTSEFSFTYRTSIFRLFKKCTKKLHVGQSLIIFR